MISLSRHIELLLLDHDCVIVPGLGGFIANMTSASYTGYPNDEEGTHDNLFLPPYRSIGFNPRLVINDGLLVQSYMQVYDASYPNAYMQMEKEIGQVLEQLELTGEYTLEGIGSLHKSLNQGITLSAMESGILTPSLYGTYSFEITGVAELMAEREKHNALSAAVINIAPIQTEADFGNNGIEEKKEPETVDTSSQENTETEAETETKTKDANVTIRINRHWFDIAIAAAVAAILFLFVSYPTLKNFGEEADTCIAGTPYIGTPSKPTKTKNDIAPDGAKRTATVGTDTPTKISTTADKGAVADNKPTVKEKAKAYTIVLASYVTEANSRIFIRDLTEAGFNEAQFIKDGKVNRIIYSGFESEQAAYAMLASLRGKASAFSDAWVMKLK